MQAGAEGGNKVSPSRLKCLEQLRDELGCAICLEVCTRPCTTACGHTFCRRCLRQALAADRQGRCPKCRAALPACRGELAVNTSLWNTIQLLFPGIAASQPDSPAAPAAAAAGQQARAAGAGVALPSSRVPEATRPAAARAFVPPRPAAPPRLQQDRPAAQQAAAAAHTELDELLAGLSLGGAQQEAPAVNGSQPSSQGGGTQGGRPWAAPSGPRTRPLPLLRPLPRSSSGLSQQAASSSQPGVIPTAASLGQPARPSRAAANPFVRTRATAARSGSRAASGGTQSGPGSGSGASSTADGASSASGGSSRCSSGSTSPERGPGAGAGAAAGTAATASAAGAAAIVDLTGSSCSSEDEEWEEIPPTPPDALASVEPVHAAHRHHQQQQAGRRVGARVLAVTLPEPRALEEEGEGAAGSGGSEDATPTDQMVPVHSLNPALPGAPGRPRRSAARVPPSPNTAPLGALPVGVATRAADGQVAGLRRSQAPSQRLPRGGS